MILPDLEFVELFKKTPGAFSVSESIALMNIASQCSEGIFIECGSNAGKSSMSAAYGLPKGKFYMVDPIFDLSNLEAWKHTIQGHPDNLPWAYVAAPDFQEKLKERILFSSHKRVEPILVGSYSEIEIPKYGNYSFAFVDSDNHSHERVFGEIDLLRTRMAKGGIIAFHDFENQYIAPREAHEHLIASGEFENVHIDWPEIFNYVRKNDFETGNDSWHQSGSEEFPRFVGACKKL